MKLHSRVVAVLGAILLLTAGVAVPAAPAQAAVACDVTYQANYWNEGPSGGGFQTTVTIANLGDPVDGWTLAFTLPTGQTFRNGWNADWRGTTDLTATNLPWNARLGTGQRVSIGFSGRWTTARTNPAAFTLNGVRCVGAPPPNRAPTATLTSPTPDQVATVPGTLRMAATASDPDGAVTAVQFYVNDTLVGTDATAPYELTVQTGGLPIGQPTEAWARAVDNGTPPLTGDSPRVPFQLVSIPPVSVIAEPTALTVDEGASATFDVRLNVPTSLAGAITVSGAPGVTVSPATLTLTQTPQRITVTAAPGSGGQVATITADAVDDPATQAATVRATVRDLEPPVNLPPTVTLTSPTTNTSVVRPDPVRMAATATDPDGSVTAVQFFVNEALVGTDTTAPYEVDVPTGSFPFGRTEVWARAFDNGSPPMTGDSARVPWSPITVPPLTIVAQPTSLSVNEGGTGTFDLRLSTPGANATAGLTVTGAPGVTVSPTSVTFNSTTQTHRITVTAAPNSGGQVATVVAAADPSQRIGQARVTVTVADVGAQVSNPYLGALAYVDPDWSARARQQAAATPGDLGRQMTAAAGQPTAVGLDSIGAISAGRGLVGHLDAALAQQQAAGAGAAVVQLVLYNLPGRDCLQRAAPGELTVDEADQRRYRTEFIDPIVAILSRPKYANLRVAVLVEPHSLVSLALAAAGPGFPPCTGVAEPYRTAVRYALARLDALSNTYGYLDASFSGFMGYETNVAGFTALLGDVVLGSGGPGGNSVTGFVTDIGQYAPLTEPHIPDPEMLITGTPVYTTRFFDWNKEIHELPFAQRLRNTLIARGFPPNIGMVVDTSRNGWGGPDRPAAPSTSTDVTTFVNQSRIDRRPTRIAWCNQVGAGIGERPRATPAPGLHAYAWITPPGLSDGVADAAAPADPDRPYLRHRDRCNPRFQEPQGAVIPSNALAGAPHWHRWFPDFFAQLVRNAHPAF
ncbi:MAG TPA: glycoside hydrolase family 6 protein [Micromonosporaceae bacterium]|nr:glycoside hydrolase family 6 protein [Micromonosporaceae bacterium]